MAKLKDTEVLTNRVYLNIKKGEEVDTREMPTVHALKEYGEKEVLYIYPPRYSEEDKAYEPEIIKKARKAGVVPPDERKAGVTDIVLI